MSPGWSSAGVIGEITGSVANFGTVLPILFAIALTTGMNLSLMLLFFAVWYILTGLVYRLPVPVEPLKAVGATAVATMSAPELIAASGILIGIIFLIIGLSGTMSYIRKKVASSVVRGVQLGLAVIFLKSACMDFIIKDLFSALLFCGIILFIFLIRRRWNIPDISALCVISIGFGLFILQSGLPHLSGIPIPSLVFPGPDLFLAAGLTIVPAQIPLTLTNAVLATSLLISDLYSREISPDRLSISVGVMSLSSSLLGGFPMCHGAGGVAAHYRFGARTGLSMIIGGIILFGLALAVTDPIVLVQLPKGMFGALLLFVAIELARNGLKTDDKLISGSIALLAIPVGMGIAFVVGILIEWILRGMRTGRINLEKFQKKR